MIEYYVDHSSNERTFLSYDLDMFPKVAHADTTKARSERKLG